MPAIDAERGHRSDSSCVLALPGLNLKDLVALFGRSATSFFCEPGSPVFVFPLAAARRVSLCIDRASILPGSGYYSPKNSPKVVKAGLALLGVRFANPQMRFRRDTRVL